MANTSVQHVIHDDYMNPDIKQQIDSFNEELVERLDSANFINANDTATPLDIYDIHDDDQPWEEDDTNNMPDAETLNEETMDKYIGTTFLLDPRRNENNVATKVKVLKQRTDLSGRPIGTLHINPLLDTREYICEMPDGTLDTYHANTIAENLWSQCDVDGNEFMSFKELLDHRKNGKAMHVDDGFVTENGIPKPKKRRLLDGRSS